MAGLFSLLGDPYLFGGAPERNVLGYILPGGLGRNRPRRRVSSGSDRSQKWVDVVDFRGYDPDTVNCHVQNGKVIIEGQMREGDADNYSRVESRRTVPIPSDVDPNSVVGQYVSRSFVLLEGKKFPPQVHEVPVQSAGQQQQLQAGDAPATKPSDAPAPGTSRHASTQASGDAHAYLGGADDYGSEDEEMINIMRRSSASPSSSAPATRGGQVAEASSSSPQGFVRKLDVSGYEPSEISVKRDGNAVTVEAVREARGRTFTGMEMYSRTVLVPDNADAAQLRASWGDGVLTLMAPYITQPPAEGNAPVSTAADPQEQQQQQEEPEKQEEPQKQEEQPEKEQQQEEQPKQEEQGQAEASSG